MRGAAATEANDLTDTVGDPYPLPSSRTSLVLGWGDSLVTLVGAVAAPWDAS
eukprot:CAMPEP_0173443978 /NCGR_PEP_ID=MMETSP1357-20121228/31251_1 /TAXON_ID=77926 /ORGANISM="Hemiselmis rufescens, Strain PCC563" /LENGTH=51 /DNA_ID=CAMNT_0014409969 /DNA_START=22 /DNA_END=173 /DNA_ORIENTATION=-